MRAAVLVGTGGPEMLEVRADVPVPRPADDGVLIEVAACGVNNTDVNTRVGWYSRSVTGVTSGAGFSEAWTDDATWGRGGLRFPRIQGADVSGRVVTVGAAVDRALLGRRVLVDPWIRDAERPADRELAGYLGSECNGGFAEYCAVPARNVYPIDTSLSDVELASFACSWSTAEHMLQRVGLRAGQSIAVTGASGGVGTALIQLAKRRGARVVAIAGRYVTSGAIAGPVVQLDLRTLYLNDLEIYGATVSKPQVFADLVGYIQRGEVRPVVAGTYPLERIHEAQATFEQKNHIGSLVIPIR